MPLTRKDAEILEYAVMRGHIMLKDYPGKDNEAFRLLIRSLR